jgi:DNA-binding LacI/PurR family transcriptional regulator
VETLPSDPAAGRAILDAAPDATAIFCMSDRQAFTLLARMPRSRHRRAADLSIVGFDGVPETATTDPPLTTVAQPTREKGRLAAEMVLHNAAPRHVMLPVELIVRRSTAPPRRPQVRHPQAGSANGTSGSQT